MVDKNKYLQDIIVPNNLSINDTANLDYYNIQTHFIRYLCFKIEIIDKDNYIINEVSGSAIDGSYNITSNSPIRRTCNLTFNLEDGYIPQDDDSLFWINKKFHLYIGLKDINNTKVYWFDKGIYAIQDPEVNVTINGNTISISGLDKMALFSGDISGQLPAATLATVDSGVTVRDVIKSIMISNGEIENKILIDNDINNSSEKSPVDMLIPYNIESNIGDTVTSVLDKLSELFANYQYYYDIDGNFIFKQKPTKDNYENFQTEWDFDNNNIIISIKENIDYSNVKNRITIWGGVHDDGYQPYYELILNNNNIDFGSSPFTVEKLGEYYPNGNIMYRDYIEQCDEYVDTILDFELYDENNIDSKVDYLFNYCVNYNETYYKCINENGSDNLITPDTNTTDWQVICTVGYLESVTDSANQGDEYKKQEFENLMEQIHAYSISLCKKKANEMLFYYCITNNTISITCVPIYSLDVNSIINITDTNSNIQGKYIVTDISCQLNVGGTMTITASKL